MNPNPDLQNQTDQIVVWLKSIEHTAHQDSMNVIACIGVLLIILILVLIIRR